MSEPTSARRRHARTGNMRRIAWWAMLAVVAAVGYVVVYASTVVERLDSTLASRAENVDSLVGEDRPEEPEDKDAGDDLNILVMGSDTRGGDNEDVGGGDVAGMRNDTTMIVHISADRTRVEAVSIPRDLQVEIPECTYWDGSTIAGGFGDFNVAFSNGGLNGDPTEAAACTIKTVEDLTGIPIDHYAVVDFTGFISMVDAIGGVPMCIPERIVSEKAHLELDAGPQVLDGGTALAYARLRTAEEGDVSGSDLQRITRQQQLLEQVAATVLSKNLLTDTDEITRFLRAAAESLTMDDEMASTSYLVGLAYSLRGLGVDDIDFVTPPWQYTADNLNVELLPEAEEVWDDIRNDRPISVTAEGDASSTWDDGKKSTEEATASPDPSSSAESSSTPSASTTEDLLAQCR